MELVKYNNNSISSVTALGSLPAGGLNLLATNTISSGVSSSSFTSNINSTYDTYIFKFINIHPATDGAIFQFNLSTDSGSNFNVGKTTTYFRATHDEADSATQFLYESDYDLDGNSTSYQRIGNEVGNGNDESVSGEMFLFSPASTVFVKHFLVTSNVYFFTNRSINEYVAGYGNTQSAIDAIDFKFSSGNIDSGIIKMFGLSKS